MIGGWLAGWLAKKGLERFAPVIVRALGLATIAALGAAAVYWHEGQKDKLTEPLTRRIEQLESRLKTISDTSRAAQDEAAAVRLARAQDQANYAAAMQAAANNVNTALRKAQEVANEKAREKIAAERRARFAAQRESESLRFNLAAAETALDGFECIVPGALGGVLDAALGIEQDAGALDSADRSPDTVSGAGLPGARRDELPAF